MKIIRFGILSVLSLFLVITAISLFIPSRVRISRAVNIQARPSAAAEMIGDLNHWKKWYPGFDTLQFIPVTIRDGMLVAARVPSSATTITLERPDSMEIKARFESAKANIAISGWKLITYQGNDSLTVQWYFDFRLHWYPWEKILSLTYDKMYGTLMEQGLGQLKKSLEP